MVYFALSSTTAYYPNPPKHLFPSGPLARMLITSQRLIWLPPMEVPAWYRLSPLIAVFTLSLLKRLTPLSAAEMVELIGITKLWKWQPEFSAPPMIQAGAESWAVQLLEDERPWTHIATPEATREHFEALEMAWEAARSRAASDDPQS